jgi:hypothetical protein
MKYAFRLRGYISMLSRTTFRASQYSRRNEMLLQWTILYRELVSQQRKKRIDAFADPLDGDEWQGFGWFVKWMEKSAEHRSEAADAKGRPAEAASNTKRLQSTWQGFASERSDARPGATWRIYASRHR